MASNPPVQQKLIAPADLAGAVALQDGLHNLIETPQFQQVMTQVIWSFVGQLSEREPALMERVRRFLAGADRNDSRSYIVRDITHNGPIKIAEREESRIFIILANLGPGIVYVGGRQVTGAAGVTGPGDASGGIPLPANNYPPFQLTQNIGELWAIAATDGADLRVLDCSGGI